MAQTTAANRGSTAFVQAAFRATAGSVPTCPVPELLDQTAALSPQAPAVEFLGQRISYGRLAQLVSRAARGLQNLGVRPGDRVGLCLPNTVYFPIFYFAALKLGAVIVNYNPLYVEKELAFQIRDSGTTVMVTCDLTMVFEKLAMVRPKPANAKVPTVARIRSVSRLTLSGM